MSTLTQAYTRAVAARTPESNRAEITREVAAMIEEMLEARQEDSASGSAAAQDEVERAVLEELGDPVLLAREYTRTPQHLIGPDWYPLFLWTVRWILPIVGVAALVINGIVYTATEPEPHLGGLIGTALGQTVGALLTAFASITVLLAVAERTAGREPSPRRSGRWTVEQLHEDSAPGASVRADSAVSLVLLALFAAVPFIPTTFLYVGHLNGGETFINPDLASGWLIGWWLLLGLLAALEVWKAVRGRFTPAAEYIGMALDLALALFLTILFVTQDVSHPELAGAGMFDGTTTTVLALAGVWTLFVWDQTTTIRALRRETAAR